LRQTYSESDIDAADPTGFQSGDVFGLPKSHSDDIGILAHLKVPASDKFLFTFGGRYDFVHASGNRNKPGDNSTRNEATIFTNDADYSLLMGYGTAEYRPVDALKFNAGAGYAMRAPNLVELYNHDAFQPVVRFGNSFTDGTSELAAERNLQFDLGVTYQRDRFLLGIRGFHSTIQNYIQPIPTDRSTAVPAGVAAPTNLHRNYSAFGIDPTDSTINFAAATTSLQYRYANLARATITGGEISARFLVSDWITVNADLAYVKGVNHSPSRYIESTNQIVPVKGAEGLPGIYPFNATVRVLIAEPMEKKWGVEVVARMVHGQHYVADSLGELPTSGFTVFDLHAYYQATEHVRVFSSILNLFDRDYTEHGSLVMSNPQGTMLRFVPERGFTLMLGVEARY
jgi:outer membrane receptor protein involved in Fe transport